MLAESHKRSGQNSHLGKMCSAQTMQHQRVYILFWCEKGRVCIDWSMLGLGQSRPIDAECSSSKWSKAQDTWDKELALKGNQMKMFKKEECARSMRHKGSMSKNSSSIGKRKPPKGTKCTNGWVFILPKYGNARTIAYRLVSICSSLEVSPSLFPLAALY